MGLRDRLRAIRMRPTDEKEPMPSFSIRFDRFGANFVIAPEIFALLARGEGERTPQEQFLVLSMLEEQGAAIRFPNGFEVSSDSVARLGTEMATVLGLPPLFTGDFLTDVRGHTNSRSFRIIVEAKVGVHPQPWQRTGPRLLVGSAPFRLDLPMLRALEALEAHEALPVPDRREAENVRLVARLQAARRLAGNLTAEDPDEDPTSPVGIRFPFDLKHLEKFETVEPERVSLTIEEEADGSLRLTPNLGTGDDPEELNTRWQQLDHVEDDEAVLRVGDKLLLLDRAKVAGVREVLRKRRIPAKHAKSFYAAPGDFLDTEIVDVELNFSVRVKGIGALLPVSFNEVTDNGISWFDEVDATLEPEAIPDIVETPEDLDRIEDAIDRAWESDEPLVAIDEHVIDVRERPRVKAALARASTKLQESQVPLPPKPDDAVQVGVIVEDVGSLSSRLRAAALQATPAGDLDYASLSRSPYEHQREGIAWMATLMAASFEESLDSPTRIQGAILADDMGLGKTLMTIVALRELMEIQRRRGEEPRPMLAVLPLSLIENWEDEIAQAFPRSPFTDLVVLQNDRDLYRYRLRGASRETMASASKLDANGMLSEEDIHLSLAVGEAYGESRLDHPGRLVLTTYETLASYQLSLGQIEWGAVVFDEAQATKNPDALRTRAAKGLKARFKLLATGTPVENSLRDLWCLMDTAQPGLLGTWLEFRDRWVKSVDSDNPAAKAVSGRALANHIRPFMMRRVKEDHLPDLPSKTVYSGAPADGFTVFAADLAVEMPNEQRDAYDAQLAHHRLRTRTSKGAALKTVQALRAVSLHPHALGEGMNNPGVSSEMSARMLGAMSVLDDVRDRGEKAIVFVINKKVQRRLALWLQQRYELPVRIVNGETRAVSKGGAETRRSMIREFESRAGFNVIIMSPLAVGTGLTIVGANHAVHLERHWNPAKEAQATDRIYRIGQKRPVHVYLPLAIHPERESFDINLDRLLRQKTSLKDAVVVPEVVSDADLAASLGLDD